MTGPELFINNFIRFGWSGHTKRQNGNDVFGLEYSACRRSPDNFRQECIRTARYIADLARDPIHVMMSGGVDSEVVCRVFKEAGVPIRALLTKYKRDIISDSRLAIDFCEAHSIPLDIVPFDEERFLREEIWEYAEKYKIHQPFSAFDIRRMEITPGFPVFGTGDIVLQWNGQQVTSYETGSFNIARVYQLEAGREGCYQFFQYTPELMLAFLQEPIMRKWIELTPRMEFEDSRYWKVYMFRHYWPEIKTRRKWTGYERFAPLYIETEEKLKKYAYLKDQLDIPVGHLVEQLTPRI